MTKQKSPKLTVEDHLENASQRIAELFNDLKAQISKWDYVQESVKGNYIGYWVVLPEKEGHLFIEVHIQIRKDQIVIHLKPVDYKDPYNKVFQFSYIPKWPLRSGMIISTKKELDYALPIIKESYKAVLELL